jgi:3-oxoacyl-[acyl-carrier protein] reductase
MFSVKDKAIIITGAAQGIGRQFAKSFAAAGAKIVCADYNDGKTTNTVREIEEIGGEANMLK